MISFSECLNSYQEIPHREIHFVHTNATKKKFQCTVELTESSGKTLVAMPVFVYCYEVTKNNWSYFNTLLHSTHPTPHHPTPHHTTPIHFTLLHTAPLHSTPYRNHSTPHHLNPHHSTRFTLLHITSHHSTPLPTPETHGETGPVHPKQSQKATLQHVKQKN